MKLRDRGYVEIELDKKRYLKFDLTAVRKYEDEFNKSLSEIGGDNIKISDLIRLVYAALIHEKIDNWNLESCEAMLSELALDEKIDFQELGQKTVEAINLYFGKSKKNQTKN